MFLRLAFFLVCSLPSLVLADANDGDFMGYRLGDVYKLTASTESKLTTTGNQLINAEHPVKPDDIASVTLIATRESATIGYITASQWFATEDAAREFGRRYFELLRMKYPDWPYGWEVMNAEMNVLEVNFRSIPYNLRLHIVDEKHANNQTWRFTMTLGWTNNSAPFEAWQNESINEQVVHQDEVRQQILKEADARGL